MRRSAGVQIAVGVVVGLATFGVATAAVGVPIFATPTVAARVDTPAFLQETAVGDVTGDGRPDVVVTRFSLNSDAAFPLTILVNKGNGAFSDETTAILGGPSPGTLWPRATVLADFNNDGRADIFVANTGLDKEPFSGAPNVLLLSAPGGKLVDASANLPAESGFSHSAAAADVNGDHTIDLYVGNICCGDTPPEILLNDGSGHFSRAAGALPPQYAEVRGALHFTRSAFADVNGDGSPDLILAAESTGPARSAVLLNDGHGHFAELPNAMPPKPFSPAAEGLAITPVDLNDDGHVDLLMGYSKGDPGVFYKGRWIQVLINDGHGTFRDETTARLPQSDNTAVWPYSIQVADLNGDGKPDVVVSLFSYPEEPAAFYLNRGDGTFTPLQQSVFAGRPPANMVAVLDANGDGRMDVLSSVAATGASPETHSVYLQGTRAKQKPKPKPTVKHKPCKRTAHHACKKH
jgi:hypothetical protein